MLINCIVDSGELGDEMGVPRMKGEKMRNIRIMIEVWGQVVRN
jgi:hypothetical protein